MAAVRMPKDLQSPLWSEKLINVFHDHCLLPAGRGAHDVCCESCSSMLPWQGKSQKLPGVVGHLDLHLFLLQVVKLAG